LKSNLNLRRNTLRDVNKVIVTGRLGKEVELRVIPSGTSVATFSVASSRNVKDGDGYKEVTEWFKIVAWDKLGENCSSLLKKGSHVYIEGRLQTRDYLDKEGQKRYSTELIATEMTILDSKKDSEARQTAGVGAGVSSDNDFDDDSENGIPF
jgi:single-strand DNA-binding protein